MTAHMAAEEREHGSDQEQQTPDTGPRPAVCLREHLLSELSWLTEGRSWARLESVLELWAGRLEDRWEGGAAGPLALMLRDGESGFGVEDDDEAGRRTAGVRPAVYSRCEGTTATACGRLTVESSRCPDTVQAVLERKETKPSMNKDILDFSFQAAAP